MRPINGARRERWRIASVLVIAGAVLVIGAASPARGQIMIATTPGGSESADPNQRQGFTVPTEESLQNNFSDFERHSERKAWEKAFATLNEIPADKRTGMLARPDGLIIPARQRIWEAIAALPADGRDAFRVFYDAKARQAWQPIVDQTLKGPAQLTAAEQIFQEWFLTSVGDNAADLLGDAAFERGDFEAADRYWRAILDKHPDSDIPEERLQFKRGLALARLGRKTAVAGIRRTLDQRFDDKTLKVGGSDVEPSKFLASVVESSEPAETPASIALKAVRAPDPETTPAWRTQFVYGRLLQQFEQALRNNYYYRNGMETLVAETATDGERLYANWFGICFAVDLKTGKLAWWTQKFTEMNNHIGNLPSSSSNLENYAIAVGHGLVVAISLPIDRLNYWQEPFRVIAYDAATGKEKWKTQDNQALSNISFVGEPLIEPDQILVLGHEREGAMLSLYSLNHQGQQQWVAALGTARKRHTPRGTEVMPQPRMIRKGSTLFVATQDGAMLAFDMVGRRLEWMLTYDGPDVGQSSRFFYGGVVDDTTLLHTQTAIAEFEGLLYLKEAGSSQLVAVDPSIPAVVWKRPVEPAAQLVGVDQDAVYVLDTELGAIDRQTHALRWATRLPIASGGLSALIGPKSIVVLTNRGLFELDRDTGNMKRIFRGADLSTLGGRLCRIGDQIVAITTESITSYRDPSSDSGGATAGATQ